MRKALGAISVAIAVLGGAAAHAQARLWTVQAVDTGQGATCDAFAAGAAGRAPYEFRFRRAARSLLLVVSYAGPKLKGPVASADIAIGSNTFRLAAEETRFGGRNAFVVSIDPASFDPNVFDRDAPFVITAGGATFGLATVASDNVAANWRACLKATKIDLNPPPPIAPGRTSLWDEQVGTAGLDYHLHFYFAGFLLRAGNVCEGDFKRTIEDAFALIADSQLKRLSNAYPDTTHQWMEEGADNFNKGVMTSGLDKACVFATTTIQSKAEKILNGRGQGGDVPDAPQTPPTDAKRQAPIEDISRTPDDVRRNIDDACSGKNPDGLTALKALGIGCNGERLTPSPTAKFAMQAAEVYYESARQRPDFRVTRECPPGGPCQTVESATRNPDRNGETLRDTFFTYEGGSQKEIWCSQRTTNLFRLCMDAADGSEGASAKSWLEAYFPNRGDWGRFELDNPACKDQQRSEYDVDNAYVACMVAKFDASQSGAGPAP